MLSQDFIGLLKSCFLHSIMVKKLIFGVLVDRLLNYYQNKFYFQETIISSKLIWLLIF